MASLGAAEQVCPPCEAIPPCPACSADEICQQIYPENCQSCPVNVCVRQPASRGPVLMVGVVCGVLGLLLLLVGLYWLYRRLRRRTPTEKAPPPKAPESECSVSTFTPLPTLQVPKKKVEVVNQVEVPVAHTLVSIQEQAESTSSSSNRASAFSELASSSTHSFILESLPNVERPIPPLAPNSPRAMLRTRGASSPCNVDRRPPHHLCDSYYGSEKSSQHSDGDTIMGDLTDTHKFDEEEEATRRLSQQSSDYAFLNALVEEYDEEKSIVLQSAMHRTGSTASDATVSTLQAQTKRAIVQKGRASVLRRSSSLFADMRRRMDRRRSDPDTPVPSDVERDERGAKRGRPLSHPKEEGRWSKQMNGLSLRPGSISSLSEYSGTAETERTVLTPIPNAASVLLAYTDDEDANWLVDHDDESSASDK